MESKLPSSDNPTSQLECKPCGKVFKHPWHLNQHLLSRKHTGETTTVATMGRNSCPVCKKKLKPRGLVSHMKAAHPNVKVDSIPDEHQQPPNPPRIAPRVSNSLRVNLNEHERAFMRDRILFEERNIAKNSLLLELPQERAAELQVEQTKLLDDLEFSNKLISHFKDMLK